MYYMTSTLCQEEKRKDFKNFAPDAVSSDPQKEKAIRVGWPLLQQGEERRLLRERYALRSFVPRLRLLRQHLVRVVFKGLSLGQISERLLDHGIPIGARAQALRLTELDGEDLLLMLSLSQSLTPSRSACVKGMFLLVRYCLNSFMTAFVNLEALVHRSIGQIDRRERKKTSFERSTSWK